MNIFSVSSTRTIQSPCIRVTICIVRCPRSVRFPCAMQMVHFNSGEEPWMGVLREVSRRNVAIDPS